MKSVTIISVALLSYIHYESIQVSFEALCCYIIRLMDKEVAQPFVVVYLHSCTGNRNYMSYTQLREFYQTLDYRYKKNLQLMYIVHPTLWSRVFIRLALGENLLRTFSLNFKPPLRMNL